MLRFPIRGPRRGFERPRRWIAAAAAAGLLIGLAVGRIVAPDSTLAGDIAGVGAGARAADSRERQASPTVRDAAFGGVGADALLVAIDAALDDRTACKELEVIDALTPRVSEMGSTITDQS